MTREELEAEMLRIHLADMGKSMVADPARRIHAMAEPAWQEIERLRGVGAEACGIAAELLAHGDRL